MTNGIHVELAISACERCPVAVLSSTTPIEEFRVDADNSRVEFVASEPPDNLPKELDLVGFAGELHGRYDICCTPPVTDGGVTIDGTVSETGADAALNRSSSSPQHGVCDGCPCSGLPSAFADFPVSPRRTEVADGELIVSFVLTGHDELQTIVDKCEDAGLEVELRRLCIDRGDRRGTDDNGRDVVPVDLARVTDRQAEIATVAAEMGYFDGDGASAETIADELGLAKSTVSEHLRAVTSALFSQLFGNGKGT